MTVYLKGKGIDNEHAAKRVERIEVKDGKVRIHYRDGNVICYSEEVEITRIEA